MREYATPAGFRMAVEARLRERARRLRVPVYIVRRQAALERLVVRLSKVAPGRWAVKGGFALETRLGERARASLDLDADHRQGADAAREDLQRAAIEDAGDYFAFAIVGTEELSEAGVRLALRYKLVSTLSGRTFEPLEVDVSIASPEPWDAEPVQRPGMLAELGFAPIEMSVVPVARQVAEKLHAYTRRYKGGGTTRARDLVDLLLIRQYERIDGIRPPADARRPQSSVGGGSTTPAVLSRSVSRCAYRPRITSTPASRSSNFACEILPTRSVNVVLVSATICETFATESFGRFAERALSRTFPGAPAHVRLLVSGTQTTVAIRLRFRASA